MGLNLYKEMTVNLQLTRQNHGFEEDNSSVTNAQRPLARGRDCDIFAPRLRERPPEPPERLLEFFDPSPQRPLSHTTLKVIDVLLTGDLSRIRSETVADSLRVSPTTLRRRLSRDNMSYQTIWIRFDHIDVRRAWVPIGSRVKASPGISVMRRSTAFIAHSADGPGGTKAT